MSFGSRGGRGGRGAGGGGGGGYHAAAAYDYGGYGGQTAGYNSGGASNYEHISYDTSSKDPVLLRARVFAGNVNTFVAGRDELIDLFSAYGSVLAMTVFKGFAFVQFANDQEADYAVQCTNGMVWNNQALDVKLAITGMKNPTAKKLPQAAYGGQGAPAKRPFPMFGGAEALQPLKRVKGLFPPGQNEANHHAAQEDTTKNGDLHTNEFPDTMICGNCRSVFTDFVQFRDHRRSPCSVPRVKEENEPNSMQCFTCEETCTNSWELVQHLVSRHGLVLYK